jgi:hypothetical protein
MNTPGLKTVAIVGASSDPERYAHKAQLLLAENAYPVVPVNPVESEILGVNAVAQLSDITVPVDTVTLYLSPKRQSEVIKQIISLKPRRVIFNPGTENPAAYTDLQQAGIEYEEACTLVLLKTDQF